jgi:ABC-2 type transport system permease protein
MMLKYLIEKEFKQFLRNAFLPKLVILMPCMMMLVLPWAADLETKNVNIAIVDNDHSSSSTRLINKILASEYFTLTDVSPTYSQAMESVEKGNSDIILEIPHGFEYDSEKEKVANLLISVNTINGTKGLIGSSYLSMIIRDLSPSPSPQGRGVAASSLSSLQSQGRGVAASSLSSLQSQETGVAASLSSLQSQETGVAASSLSSLQSQGIQVTTQSRFNPKMEYKAFMVPALMVMLITLIAGFLPALNIVSEKETGTIEQINVTPVRKITFILSKLIPYWIIGFVVLTTCFTIAFLVYGLIPAGNFLTLYSASLIYVLAVSGFGLVISNYSNTMQQSMFVMFFFMIIFMLMSGLFTPVRSMPQWAQNITIFNPLKYFIQIMRNVYLKGSDFSDIATQTGALCCFAIVSNIWAVLSYRKTT